MILCNFFAQMFTLRKMSEEESNIETYIEIS